MALQLKTEHLQVQHERQLVLNQDLKISNLCFVKKEEASSEISTYLPSAPYQGTKKISVEFERDSMNCTFWYKNRSCCHDERQSNVPNLLVHDESSDSKETNDHNGHWCPLL